MSSHSVDSMEVEEDSFSSGVFDVRQEERLHRHLDGVDCNASGAVCLVSSSLAGRQWDGCLWVYGAPYGLERRKESDSSCASATSCHPVGTGLSDVVWASEEMIAATDDTGSLQVFRFSATGSDADAVLTPHALHSRHDGMATCVGACGGGGAAVVSGGTDGHVVRWDLAGGRAVEDVRAHATAVSRVATASTQPAVLVTCALGDRPLLWDTRTARTRPCSAVPGAAHAPSLTTAAAFSADDLLLAVGNADGYVAVHDLRALSSATPSSASPPSSVVAGYSHGDVGVVRLAFAKHRPSLLASCGYSTLSHVVDTAAGSGTGGTGGASCALIHSVLAPAVECAARGLSWSPSGVLRSCGLNYHILSTQL